MAGRKNKILKSVIFHLFTLALGFLMVYPLLWLIASSFKSNATMFQNTYSLIPSEWGAIDNYKAAFEGVAGVSFLEFLWNTIVVTVVGIRGRQKSPQKPQEQGQKASLQVSREIASAQEGLRALTSGSDVL